MLSFQKLASTTDFEVYGGTIGSWYSHVQVACTTGGAPSAVLPMPAGDVYYLVVPRSARMICLMRGWSGATP